jgi:hypothetical protein
MPQAKLPTEGDWQDICWENIIRQGQQNDTEWMKRIHHVLERELFDISDAALFIQEAIENLPRKDFPVSHLMFMASIHMFDCMLSIASQFPVF